jgi:hypothetical protein
MGNEKGGTILYGTKREKVYLEGVGIKYKNVITDY